MRKFFKFWQQRFHFLYLEHFSRLQKSDLRTIKSAKTPIILVAGIYASVRSLLPLKKFLESEGYSVYLPQKRKNYEAVPVLAKRLQERIKKIPTKKVQIIAHSMGGITTMKALQDPKTFAKVSQVITLGSPLNGCILGSLAFWERRKNRKYLALFSRDIAKLNSNLKINKKVRTLYSRRDGVVFPKSMAKLRGAKENAELSVIGHVGLILARSAWEEVLKRLVK